MNYPIWNLTTIGGGTLIAVIAILHVYISHLAVGGGMFLWWTDRKSVRTHDARLTEYVRRHTWFFLLLTMVFGGVTGVGIWFIIALVQPSGTSVLIHNFVFGWAIEWVFFVGEIVALLIYHYRFRLMAERDRLRVAFLYFLFAWLSLVVINAILTFMLTPGKWLQTHDFWDGVFNPSYWPALVFRTFGAAMLAGLFGLVTAVRTPERDFRARLLAYCSKWLLVPFLGLIPSAIWYYYAIPADIRVRNFTLNPQMLPFIDVLVSASVVIILVGLVLIRRSSPVWQRALVALLVLVGLVWIGGFEYIREISRKPFIISGYLYTNAIAVDDVPKLEKEGVLASAGWSAIKEVTPDNLASAGEELFRLECLECHTINGIRNDIVPRIKNLTYLGVMAQLTGQGKIQTYMPPFVGTQEEKKALAYYLTTVLNGKPAVEGQEAGSARTDSAVIPPFDPKTSEYVLLVWNDLGMHCLSDGDAWFCFLPPANTLEAQLIRRGDPPQITHDGVELIYRVDKGFKNPSAHSSFWKNAASLFGTTIENNTGLFGKKVDGTFDYDSTRNSFIAAGIPVVPYNDNGTYNPYPMFTVEAREKSTGRVFITTRVVAPVSSELGCRNCHGGGWRIMNSGLADETAMHILAAHDRLNGTDLLTLAESGKPQLCQSCHPDPVLAASGKPGVVDFSAAMHGWHANYMPFDDSRSCGLCHPNSPTGNTRCLRDPHAALGLGCVDCHGTMQEDAVALLETQRVKPPAQRLLAPLAAAQKDSITPRVAWLGETDCLNCHRDFQQPMVIQGFNMWTKQLAELYRVRTDYAGVRCPACHGSTHALYPSHNMFDRDHDNIQPLQYSGTRAPIGTDFTCALCHRKRMQDALHHPNMERPMRNTDLLQ
jgi:hypothetical protein